MAWTDIARREHSREGLRYPSDMTDREWMLSAPFIPPAKSGGRRRTSDMREVVNAMLYIAASGCAWRLLPKCFPPVSTVRRYFYAWRDAGLFDDINMVLVMNLREIEGREASPSAGVIDSQSVKSAEKGGSIDPVGYDAAMKVKGCKRHILTHALGLLVGADNLPRCPQFAADLLDRLPLDLRKLTYLRNRLHNHHPNKCLR